MLWPKPVTEADLDHAIRRLNEGDGPTRRRQAKRATALSDGGLGAPSLSRDRKQVMTPNGPGTIVDTRTSTHWIGGRPRHRVIHIVEYRNGHRHAWVPEKLKELP